MAAPVARPDESLSLFIAAWSAFARLSPTGEVLDTPGLTIASANTSLPTLNAAFLTIPAEWEARAAAARDYFASHQRPGLLVICGDWLTDEALTALANTGAHAGMELTGMAADRLEAPARTLPELQFRRVVDEDTRFALADMNCLSYGMPLDWGRESVGTDTHWGGANFGHIGYTNGQPVTAAATLVIGGVLYVGWVATLPSHRQRGYAEAVMRHSLEEARRASGIERTVLHATPAGYAVYERMGYQPQRRFTLFNWNPTH